jgi:hypothetical protein
MKQILMWSGVVVAVLCVVLLINIWIYHRDCNSIREWGLESSQNIESIEKRVWSRGPFVWNSKYNRVYMATTSTGKIVWFRFGNLFRGMEVETESGDF